MEFARHAIGARLGWTGADGQECTGVGTRLHRFTRFRPIAGEKVSPSHFEIPGTRMNSSTANRSRVVDTQSGQPEVAAAVLKLLDAAGTALEHDRAEVRACLARAAALLSTERSSASVLPASSPRTVRGGLARWQVTRLLEYIDEHLAQSVTATDLASLVRLSASHFFRAFKESFGEAPLAYLAHRRMERAKQMMLETREPLSQIALACGLCDQSHFTRVFRRVVGMSPNAWRREHAREQNSFA
jgi:AraC-like DNA-binding protein